MSILDKDSAMEDHWGHLTEDILYDRMKASLDRFNAAHLKKENTMTEEDDEFNRIEREAAMRMEAVSATVAKREWVGLTDEDIALIDWESLVTKKDCVRAIEAKLREKNT